MKSPELSPTANCHKLLFLVAALLIVDFVTPAGANPQASPAGNNNLPEAKCEIQETEKLARASGQNAGESAASGRSPGAASLQDGPKSPQDAVRPIFFRKPWTGPWISTDRNSVTPHPDTVPQGYLQVENGMSFGKLHHGGFFNVPETLVRLGILENTELRFETPNYFYIDDNGKTEGTSDITLAFKHELEPDFLRKRGLNIGVIAGTTMPTGTKGLTTGKFAPFVQIITFQDIGKWTLASAQSIFIPSEIPITIDPAEDAKSFLSYQPTAMVHRHIGKRIDLWAEYAGDFLKSGDSLQIIDFGALYRPAPPQQVDFRLGFGVSDIAPRAFINIGYSVLIGKLSPLR